MNYFRRKNLKLVGRNEGKIKSYESCSDLRAWSHDLVLRDRYLKEWMRCNTRISILPICTLSSFLRIMTLKNCSKVPPRCHPNCKSKVLLESICTSCHAMKQCLKNNQKFDEYFYEEEFETTHWPCERCLDALKSIKMFWKIIVEKVLNVNILKTEQFEMEENVGDHTDNLRSVAKVWQKEMVKQAVFVKSISPFGAWRSVKCSEKGCDCNIESKDDTRNAIIAKVSNVMSDKNKARRDEKSSVNSKSYTKISNNKICKSTSVHVKTLNVSCEATDNTKEELKAFKINLAYIQNQLNVKNDEVKRLTTENNNLKVELQNIYNSPIKKTHCDQSIITKENKVSFIPYESCDEQTETDPVKNIDSEMIITMKNCKNEAYKHVSLLQVLHKTNDPVLPDVNFNYINNQNEDPIDLLTKVQNTFGAIVKREITMANERRLRPKNFNIEAKSHRGNFKSPPSGISITSTSESDFGSRNIEGHAKIINI